MYTKNFLVKDSSVDRKSVDASGRSQNCGQKEDQLRRPFQAPKLNRKTNQFHHTKSTNSGSNRNSNSVYVDSNQYHLNIGNINSQFEPSRNPFSDRPVYPNEVMPESQTSQQVGQPISSFFPGKLSSEMSWSSFDSLPENYDFDKHDKIVSAIRKEDKVVSTLKEKKNALRSLIERVVVPIMGASDEYPLKIMLQESTIVFSVQRSLTLNRNIQHLGGVKTEFENTSTLKFELSDMSNSEVEELFNLVYAASEYKLTTLIDSEVQDSNTDMVDNLADSSVTCELSDQYDKAYIVMELRNRFGNYLPNFLPVFFQMLDSGIKNLSYENCDSRFKFVKSVMLAVTYLNPQHYHDSVCIREAYNFVLNSGYNYTILSKELYNVGLLQQVETYPAFYTTNFKGKMIIVGQIDDDMIYKPWTIFEFLIHVKWSFNSHFTASNATEFLCPYLAFQLYASGFRGYITTKNSMVYDLCEALEQQNTYCFTFHDTYFLYSRRVFFNFVSPSNMTGKVISTREREDMNFSLWHNCWFISKPVLTNIYTDKGRLRAPTIIGNIIYYLRIANSNNNQKDDFDSFAARKKLDAYKKEGHLGVRYCAFDTSLDQKRMQIMIRTLMNMDDKLRGLNKSVYYWVKRFLLTFGLKLVKFSDLTFAQRNTEVCVLAN